MKKNLKINIMKNKIKEILREDLSSNINFLNVKITRPSQILIIMRGVP
jgi:hypothetical protein